MKKSYLDNDSLLKKYHKIIIVNLFNEINKFR